MGRSYVFVGIQMVLAIFIITEAFGAETEFQRGIILFRPAADSAFMLGNSLPADWVCFLNSCLRFICLGDIWIWFLLVRKEYHKVKQ